MKSFLKIVFKLNSQIIPIFYIYNYVKYTNEHLEKCGFSHTNDMYLIQIGVFTFVQFITIIQTLGVLLFDFYNFLKNPIISYLWWIGLYQYFDLKLYENNNGLDEMQLYLNLFELLISLLIQIAVVAVMFSQNIGCNYPIEDKIINIIVFILLILGICFNYKNYKDYKKILKE